MDEKKNPIWDFSKGIKLGEGVKVVLKSDKALSTGVNSFGKNWHLWVVDVTNQATRLPDKSIKNNYSGEAVFFASDNMNDKLINLNPVQGMTIEIKKLAKQSGNGKLYTAYDIVSLGEPASGSTSLNELRIVDDVKKLIKDGTLPRLSEELFLVYAKEKGIELNRAKELFKLI